MDHHEAVQSHAVEKYVLDELSPAQRDEFEQHFFECQECAADLQSTAAFLKTAKKEFRRGPGTPTTSKVARKPWFAFLWRPAVAMPAFALLLLVVAYQNAVVYPRLGARLAKLNHPEVLAMVSLIAANSRGGPLTSVKLTPDQPLLVSVDIPAAAQYTSYTCELVSPGGDPVWRVPVSAEEANDTVSLRIPGGQWRDGDYILTVLGHAGRERAELAHYRFMLHVSD